MKKLLALCFMLATTAGCPLWIVDKLTSEHAHCAAKVCPDPETACYCNMCQGWCPR